MKILVIQGLVIVSIMLSVVAATCFYSYGRDIFLGIGSNDKSL